MEQTMMVPTTELKPFETTRVIVWAGMYFQEPIMGVREQLVRLPSNVYITSTSYGSPALRYGVAAGTFVIDIDGKPVHTLDDLYAILKLKSKVYKKAVEGGEDVGEVDAMSEASIKNAATNEDDIDAMKDTRHKYARITTIDMHERPKVISLRIDEHY
ncbi:hypothetical protein EV182_008238, partial [Spiromyces aspiralis]